ncbi:hypothetical protein NDU88_004059 [Pleurodeles waltl]|uniref:Uncharacterized protein n=1 Tax=Pleurodeles waltl TaxID=8319 RepID=A0AAV7NL65_PLEWA|nr:hypothetical protein NDU88_004059 [Pleurodeles waltl]
MGIPSPVLPAVPPVPLKNDVPGEEVKGWREPILWRAYSEKMQSRSMRGPLGVSTMRSTASPVASPLRWTRPLAGAVWSSWRGVHGSPGTAPSGRADCPHDNATTSWRLWGPARPQLLQEVGADDPALQDHQSGVKRGDNSEMKKIKEI